MVAWPPEHREGSPSAAHPAASPRPRACPASSQGCAPRAPDIGLLQKQPSQHGPEPGHSVRPQDLGGGTAADPQAQPSQMLGVQPGPYHCVNNQAAP